jgi:hypothetical protein
VSHSLFAIAVFTGVVASMSSSSAATDGVPKFDLEHSCRLEISASSVGGETMASCKPDEEGARDALLNGPRSLTLTTLSASRKPKSTPHQAMSSFRPVWR